jgi:hypothetical protein
MEALGDCFAAYNYRLSFYHRQCRSDDKCDRDEVRDVLDLREVEVLFLLDVSSLPCSFHALLVGAFAQLDEWRDEWRFRRRWIA